jgi:hypothetical protein
VHGNGVERWNIIIAVWLNGQHIEVPIDRIGVSDLLLEYIAGDTTHGITIVSLQLVIRDLDALTRRSDE